MDLVALSIIAGKERSRRDWEKIVASVGKGLAILSIRAEQQNAFGVVELGFSPSLSITC